MQILKVLLIALGPVLAVILVNMKDRFGWWAIVVGAVPRYPCFSWGAD